MTIIAIANPKGGAGKSTLATNIAGYWASRGHDVMLGDVDAQQSSRLWLSLRAEAARPIRHWAVQTDFIVRPAHGSDHIVLDTPAALSGLRLREVMRLAGGVLIPVQPGVFDLTAARTFIDQVRELNASAQIPVALVGMRVKENTVAAAQWQAFADDVGLPVAACLRATQNYVRLAAAGQTLFDAPPSRVRRDLEQWQGLTQWLDAVA